SCVRPWPRETGPGWRRCSGFPPGGGPCLTKNCPIDPAKEGEAMARQEKQKRKLLALVRIFESETDETHRLTVPQLAEKLEAQGIPCERKSIYTDIDALREMGYEILLQRGRGGGYWLAHRTFELAELKLLVDAV